MNTFRLTMICLDILIWLMGVVFGYMLGSGNL